MINKQRLLNTFIELLEINSPSFREHEIALVITNQLKNCGFDVFLQDYGQSINLIATKRGTDRNSPGIILNAHMDTVEETNGLDYSIDDTKIQSIGATILGADDKSGIAQILEALRVINETKLPHGDIEVVFTSAEEKGLCGAKNLDFSLLKGRHALVLDCSGSVGQLITAAPTHITYTMTIRGKASHAGIEPEKGISSIRVASEIISSIPDGRIDEFTTANVGVINGGSATNVVPLQTTIRGEMRSHNQQTLNMLKDEIFNTALEVTNKRKAQLKIDETLEYEAFSIDSEDPFLRLLKEVYRECGITPKLTITGGGSDANIFNKAGIKAINISNGMQSVHSKEEFILLDDLVKGAEIVLATINKLYKSNL